MSALDARLSAIRDRIASLTSVSSKPTVAPGTADAPGAGSAGFDPFGAAYQQALQGATQPSVQPSTTAAASTTLPAAQLVRRTEALGSYGASRTPSVSGASASAMTGVGGTA